MEVPVKRAQYVGSPVEGRFQHWIVFHIVGNESWSNLGIDQLCKIMESLRVSLDIESRERPDCLESRIIQDLFGLAQQEWRQNQYVFGRIQDREQKRPRHTFRVWIGPRKNVGVENDPHFRVGRIRSIASSTAASTSPAGSSWDLWAS